MTHQLCAQDDSILPSRVIDVGKTYPIRLVKLYWSEDEQKGQYAGQYGFKPSSNYTKPINFDAPTNAIDQH